MEKSLLKEWEKTKQLTRQGYKILDKEMTIAIPGPCFPAYSQDKDTGIGSPYGQGGKDFCSFWNKVVDKVLLGPSGKTFAPLFSPYESTLSENPLFIPLENWTGKLLLKKTLQDIYDTPKQDGEIFYPAVSRSYNKALLEMYQTFLNKLEDDDAFALDLKNRIYCFIKDNPLLKLDAKYHAPFDKERYFFESFLAYHATISTKSKIPTIGDLQVKIPEIIYFEYPQLFLKNFTLGSPPDIYSDKNQDWFFKVFNPDYIFNKDGSLGKAGVFLYQIFDMLFKSHKGGIRVDHYIGFVNPFVIARNPKYKSGRLYSSYDNSVLKKYKKQTIQNFADITQKIILKAMADNHMTVNDIYPEDLGARPEQLDKVLDFCHLGRMIVPQFANIDNAEDAYHLKNARKQDIAALDTHDMPSIIDYFAQMTDADRYKHALNMAEYLRFDYSDFLKSDTSLIRMKWAELLTCPAKRVQAFFTSFTGQKGRYNDPTNPKKWRLRCVCHFKELYFQNLIKGIAYNPLDAIALAIYARGDDFYNKHKDFVAKLRQQEEILFNTIKETI